MIESDIFVIANFAKEFLKILLKNFRISVQKRLNEIGFFFPKMLGTKHNNCAKVYDLWDVCRIHASRKKTTQLAVINHRDMKNFPSFRK